MWAAHRQRTEGRAGRAHLLLARSLDAVEDTPEGAEVASTKLKKFGPAYKRSIESISGRYFQIGTLFHHI